MQRLCVVLLIVLCCLNHSQAQQKDACYLDSNEQVYAFVEQMPAFPGGNDSLFAFLYRSLQYPESDVCCAGKVIVRFIVLKTGKICDPSILKSPGCAWDKSVIELMQLMPNWKPGKQNGKEVNVTYTLPININPGN